LGDLADREDLEEFAVGLNALSLNELDHSEVVIVPL
jgi:hypothetical protein